MTRDKARTDRIQRVYRSKDYEELTSEYNAWASGYDADLQSLGFTGPRAGAETLAKYVADKEAKVPDAGAGTGLVGEELARLGFKRITALDLSPGMLRTASEKSVYEELVVGELGKPLGFETGQFAGTTCIGTLTFGHAPPESLDELVRVTKAGGRGRVLDADGLLHRGPVRREAGGARRGWQVAAGRTWRAVPADAARRAGHAVRDLDVRGGAHLTASWSIASRGAATTRSVLRRTSSTRESGFFDQNPYLDSSASAVWA